MGFLSGLIGGGLGFLTGGPAGAIAGGLGGLTQGGGGAGNALAGALTSQRIPGQTRAGEYTPPEGGFGTYNYIPTGATQIDPALINAILNSNSWNDAASRTGIDVNRALLTQGMGAANPAYAAAMANVGQFANDLSTGGIADLGAQYRPMMGETWGAGQNQLANYAQLMGMSQNNPFTSNYISGAQNIGQGVQSAGGQLQGAAQNYLGGVQGQVGALASNPYMQLAQAGSNQAGGMLQNAGMGSFGQGQQFSNMTAQGMPAAGQVLNTAFDPQQALYNRTLGQTQDQIGVMLARMGLTDSGAGAGLASDALNNFNIDWQNNQLGRQTAGLQSYGNAMTQAGQNLGQGQNLQATGAGMYGQGAQMPYSTYQGMGATQLGNLEALGRATTQSAYAMPTAAGLQFQGNQAGYGAYGDDLANQLAYASAYGQGANQLANTYGQMGQGVNNMTGMMNQALNWRNAGAQAPFAGFQGAYGQQNDALSNYLGNAGSVSNLTNQNIGQQLQYLNHVMQGSANASNAASGSQARTVDQNANAAAGLAPIINSGLSWLGNQFGGGGTNSFGLTQNQVFNPQMAF